MIDVAVGVIALSESDAESDDDVPICRYISPVGDGVAQRLTGAEVSDAEKSTPTDFQYKLKQVLKQQACRICID